MNSINERLDLNDESGLRGIVTFVNPDTNEVILKTHNLVLMDGRKILADKIASSEIISTNTSESGKSYSNYKFTKLFLNDCVNENNLNYTYNNENWTHSFIIDLTKDNVTYNIDSNKIYFEISIDITKEAITEQNSSLQNITDLGIICEDSENSTNQPILFSRARIETIPLGQDMEKVALKYCLYI